MNLAYIMGDLHKLVQMKEGDAFNAWRIHDHDDFYWVPVVSYDLTDHFVELNNKGEMIATKNEEI